MPDKRFIHIKKTRVGYSNLDSQGKIKIVSILNLLQDIASEHACEMGVSGFDLAKKDLAWVIVQYQIEIKTFPGWLDNIKIETWRTPVKNLYELRQFKITSDHSMEILSARAFWVMIKKQNSRPVRLSRYMPDRFLDRETDQDEPLLKKLGKPEHVDCELSFKVRIHDLDLNGHVNNAIYLEWAIETVPQKLLRTHRPENLEVTFQQESFYGDRILSKTQVVATETPGQFKTFHSIVDLQTNSERACINILWRPAGKK